MTDCLEWQGARNPRGYGRVGSGYAHRIAWEQANDTPIPEGMVVRHSCDNPPCVNPEHLLLGTQAENMADKIERGRANVPFGERHTSAKLTAEDVREIRQWLDEDESCRSIGRAYGVSHQVISDIKLGKSWRSVC